MYHIAIVEDELIFSNQLQEYMKQYQEEHNVRFKISVFHDGAEIVQNYQAIYDIILLDISMPQMNGMDAAKIIREKDSDVSLMFITNMASYAIKGYEVGALDFVMKPINYYTFSMKLGRALKRTIQRARQDILLTLPDGVKKFHISDILYVEVQNRMLHYHTLEEEYVVRGTMQSVEELLAPYPFVKCNHWYIVNLMHVSEVHKSIVIVGGHELEISRRNRTAFLKALTEYIGGGNG